MNNNLTEMVFILDMSGSMDHLTSDTIGGYNSLINKQKEEPGDANVTTVLFNDTYKVLHNRANIKDVPKMTTSDYTAYGTTAMLDAIGKTFYSIGTKLANTPEEERPGVVIVTIITDGMENSSKEFTWDQIKEIITHQREKYSWVITFIGANIDTMEVGENLGIDPTYATSYTASAQGTSSVYCATANMVSLTRDANAKGMSVTSDEFTTMMMDALNEVE